MFRGTVNFKTNLWTNVPESVNSRGRLCPSSLTETVQGLQDLGDNCESQNNSLLNSHQVLLDTAQL